MLFTGRDLNLINFLYDSQDTNKYLKADDHHREVTLESENSVSNTSMITEHKQITVYD